MTNELKALLNDKKMRTDFNSFYYTTSMFKNLPFGKTLYTLRNGKLVAFRLIEMVFCGSNETNSCGSYSDGMYNSWKAHINIANDGHKLVWIGIDFEWFYSVEEYREYCNSGENKYKHIFNKDTFSGIRMDKFLCNFFGSKEYYTTNTWYHCVKMYYANQGTINVNDSNVVVNCLYIDDCGIHLETDYKNRCGDRVYPTKEDALLNAMVSDVVEFEDEEKEEKTTEMEININIKVKSKDDAIEQFAKYIETKF